jgi:hypothetical protein
VKTLKGRHAKATRPVARRLTAAMAAAALFLAGCGGSNSREVAASEEGAALTVGGGVVKGGDAATNPACALVEVAAIQKIVPPGERLIEIHGTTTPGQFAANAHNCFWITDGPAPWVASVNLEDGLGPQREAAVASIEESVRVGFDAFPQLGDVAVTGPSVIRLVAGERYLMVSVDAADTGKDAETAREQAVELARTSLAR